MEKDQKKRTDIFEYDEMRLGTVSSYWNSEDLLKQEAMFFLKDVVSVLDLDSAKVKNHIAALRGRGHDPYQTMGTRRIWSHWLVRMKVFAPYYRTQLVSVVRKIEDGWDANMLIRQKGWFYLTDVCKLLPFSCHQIRYQAKKTPNAHERLGVWKHAELKSFLVDMERFAPWVAGLWRELHGAPTPSAESASRREKDKRP